MIEVKTFKQAKELGLKRLNEFDRDQYQKASG
jgi:hypothetical protein